LKVRYQGLDLGAAGFQDGGPAQWATAGDDWIALEPSQATQVFLFAGAERADDGVGAVVAQELERHRGQPSLEKLVDEQGFDQVVHVMAEGDLGEAHLLGIGIEHASPQARTHGAWRDLRFLANHGVDGRRQDLVGNAQALADFGDAVRVVAGESGVDGDAVDLELDGRALSQGCQQVEQCPGILAAAESHQDTVAIVEQFVFCDARPETASEALLQLREAFQVLLGRR